MILYGFHLKKLFVSSLENLSFVKNRSLQYRNHEEIEPCTAETI